MKVLGQYCKSQLNRKKNNGGKCKDCARMYIFFCQLMTYNDAKLKMIIKECSS